MNRLDIHRFFFSTKTGQAYSRVLAPGPECSDDRLQRCSFGSQVIHHAEVTATGVLSSKHAFTLQFFEAFCEDFLTDPVYLIEKFLKRLGAGQYFSNN